MHLSNISAHGDLCHPQLQPDPLSANVYNVHVDVNGNNTASWDSNASPGTAAAGRASHTQRASSHQVQHYRQELRTKPRMRERDRPTDQTRAPPNETGTQTNKWAQNERFGLPGSAPPRRHAAERSDQRKHKTRRNRKPTKTQRNTRPHRTGPQHWQSAIATGSTVPAGAAGAT